MKRLSVILLMFLYLVPVVGVTVSAHYCGSLKTAISYNPFDTSHKCACGSEKMKNDCCKDENTVIKLNNDQHKVQQFTLNIFKWVDFHALIVPDYASSFRSLFIDSGLYNTHHPPDDERPALYILHRVLLI